MKLHSIMLGAAALFALSAGSTFADDYLGGLVKSADIGGKEVLTDANGMTLYTYDKDEMGVASNCYDKCAENWPPLFATADTKAEAQATGRQMAIDRGVEHVVKKMDGTIGERNTYPRSRDKNPPKG